MVAPLSIPCPECSALNRVPADRIGQQPACGRCHRLLFGGHPVTLTAANFDAVAARGDLPVLVDFWATWCGPCLGFAPVFADAAASLEPRVRLGKVDTDAEPSLARRFGIRSIPTLVLLRGGQEIARHAGAASAGQLQQFVAQSLR